jgi:hypothetical protein
MTCINLPEGFLWKRSTTPACPDGMDLFSGGTRIARVKPLSLHWIAIIEDRFSIGFDLSYSADSQAKCIRWVQKWSAKRHQHLLSILEASDQSADADSARSRVGLPQDLCGHLGEHPMQFPVAAWRSR